MMEPSQLGRRVRRAGQRADAVGGAGRRRREGRQRRGAEVLRQPLLERGVDVEEGFWSCDVINKCP